MAGRELPLPVRQAFQKLPQFLMEFYGGRLLPLLPHASHLHGDFQPDLDVPIPLGGEVRFGQEPPPISHRMADAGLKHNVPTATFPVPEEGLRVQKGPLFENDSREGISLYPTPLFPKPLLGDEEFFPEVVL